MKLPSANGNGDSGHAVSARQTQTQVFSQEPPEDHVHAGFDEDENPVNLPANVHWDVRGGTGSGKTAFIGYVLVQFILRFRNAYLCVIDLGGDPFLYHLCRQTCAKAGRLFRDFTLATSFHYYFDPIAACTANASVTEQAAIVTNGLGLWYGSGYGKGFHGSANKEEIESPLERLYKADIPARLHTLADEMLRGKRVRQRDISEAELRLRSMRRVPQLSIADDPTNQITFTSGFDVASLDYFYLPTNRDEVMPVSVGTMALAGILNEATTRRERNLPERYAHVFIDEAALLNGARTMESKLPIARKWLSMKLIYQYRSQWYEHGRYMPDSLASNCPVQIRFNTTCEDDFRELELESDDEPKQLGSFTSAGLSVRKTVRDEIRPRLERNRIRQINQREGWAFYSGSARKGDPLPFKIAYPTTIEEHKRLSHTPIRPLTDALVQINAPKQKAASEPLDSGARRRLQHALRKILVEAKDRESWEPK